MRGKKQPSKSPRFLRGLAGILALGIGLTCFLLFRGEDEEVPDFYADMVRAEVAAYFSSAWQVDLGADQAAWKVSYGGEVPAEMLDEKVQSLLNYDKALQKLAEQYGVEPAMPVGDILLAQWEAFNRQRAESLAQGEVLYGPEQFDLLAYYLECRSDAETALVEYLLEDAMENRRELLLERYESAPTADLTASRQAVLRAYIIDPEEFTAAPEAVASGLTLLREHIAQNGDCTLEELNGVCGFPLGIRELTLDNGAFSREDSFSPQLLALAAESDCFIGPLDASGNYSCVYQVLDYSCGERPAFEDVLVSLAAAYANETLDQKLAQLTGA